MKATLALLIVLLAGCSRIEVKAPPRETKFFHVRWAKELDSLYTTGNLPLTYGGVSSTDGVLVVGSLDGQVRGVDVENGRELWKAKEGTPIAAPAVIDGESAYYGTQGGRLIVRHPVSGAMKYAIDLGAPIESAPVIHEGRLLIYLRGHQVACLDAATGKVIWNYRRAVPVSVTLQRTTRPLILGDKVIIGFADGFAGALSLQEGTLIWEQKLVETQKFVDVDLNPIQVENLIVTGSPSGQLKALDPTDGSIRRDFGVGSLSHPLLRGQSLILGTMDGEIIFLGFDGAILKRHKVTDSPINQVFWWKDHLVLANFDGELLAIDPLTFQEVGRFALGHDQSALFGDVALSEQGMGVLSSRNRLYFFE